MSKSHFNLDKFVTQVRTGAGLSRTNRFEVIIAAPTGLPQIRRNSEDLVSLYVDSASFPTFNLAINAFKIFGPAYQRPITSDYGGEGMPITFNVDREMKIKSFFDDWCHLVVDPVTFTVGYPKEYASTINIRQLDEQNNINYELELIEAFPRSLSTMELSNSSQNQTHRLTVTFAYRYWKNVTLQNAVPNTNVPTPANRTANPVIGDPRNTTIFYNT